MRGIIEYHPFTHVYSTHINLGGLFPLYMELAEYDLTFIKDKVSIPKGRKMALVNEAFQNIDTLVMAKVNNQIVGFVATSRGEPELISELFVVEGYRRQGVARKLVQQLKKIAPGKLKVNTIMGNDASLAFYESMGFVAVTIGLTEV